MISRPVLSSSRPRTPGRLLAALLLATALAGCAALPSAPAPLGYDEIAQRVAAREPDDRIVRDIRSRGVAGGSPPATEDIAKLEAAGASEAIRDAVLIAAWQPPRTRVAEPAPAAPWIGWGPYPGPYPSWGWSPWPGYGYGPAWGLGVHGGFAGGGRPHPPRPGGPAASVGPGGVGSPFRPTFPRPVRGR